MEKELESFMGILLRADLTGKSHPSPFCLVPALHNFHLHGVRLRNCLADVCVSGDFCTNSVFRTEQSH